MRKKKKTEEKREGKRERETDRQTDRQSETDRDRDRENKRGQNGRQNKTNDVPFKQAKLSTTVISNRQSLCRYRAVKQKAPRQETFCATVYVCVCVCVYIYMWYSHRF